MRRLIFFDSFYILVCQFHGWSPVTFFSWSNVDILVFLCRNQAYNSKWERRCEKRHFLYRNFKFFVKCLRMKQARSFALRVQFWLFSGLCAKVCSYQAEKISFPLWDFEKRIRSCGCLFFSFFSYVSLITLLTFNLM